MSNPKCKAGCGFICNCDVIDFEKDLMKPAGYGCLNTEGDIEYTAPTASMCHEHINDGINNFCLDDMAKLKVVQIFYKIDA